MSSSRHQSIEELETALRGALENERRWMEACPGFAFDSDQMEQWANTAKLRRLEVERIKTLIANSSPI